LYLQGKKQVSKHGKRYDNESIFCTICLEEWHKQDENSLWTNSDAAEQLGLINFVHYLLSC
jgi:hypothetical protein